jgi:exonuclease SbcD
MRFIHAADIHLDTAFSSRSEDVRKRLREASRTAFKRLVDLALNEKVDAVLLAGDLFDGRRLSFETECFLLEQLHRLNQTDTPVVYATGNHDPGHEGHRFGKLKWPSNVTIAQDRDPVNVSIVRDGEILGTVTAVGHRSSTETEDLSKYLQSPDSQFPAVAVLHTQVLNSPGSGDHERYAPSHLDHLKNAGFDYWALGHVHKHSCLCGHPGIYYPGNLQGRTHKERGAKGCLLVDISQDTAPIVKFKDIAPIRWEDVEIKNPTDAVTLDTLVQNISSRWNMILENNEASEWMVRVRISGATPLWRELLIEENQEYLTNKLEEHLNVLEVIIQIDNIHPKIRAEDYASREDVLGQILRLVATVRSGDITSAEIPTDQLIGLENKYQLDEYVKKILHTGEEEILTRMLKGVIEPQ